VIEARGLTKRYGRTVAVDDLSFTVHPGRVTGFLGPNGAGKSTTMRLALGLDHPDAGAIHIDGQPYRRLGSPLRTVGALLDPRWVHPNRTARAHLRWLAVAGGIPATRIDEVLDLVGLANVADKRAGGFSLGMSQRLGIAAALLGDPSVLLFDEPANGLDPEGIHWIRTLLKNLAGEGRTVLVSSHLLSEMTHTADELIVVGRGKLITQTTTTEFIERATKSAVLVRTPQVERLRGALRQQGYGVTEEPDGALAVTGATGEQIGEIAAAHGVVLHELSPRRGSLEEAFMQLTGDAVEYPGQSTGTPDTDLQPAGR
jgi:ABC-2 type transport system ATP-binding protein